MMKVSPSSAPPVTGSALAAHRGRGRARSESPARRRAPRRTAAERHARGATAGGATVAPGCAMDSGGVVRGRGESAFPTRKTAAWNRVLSAAVGGWVWNSRHCADRTGKQSSSARKMFPRTSPIDPTRCRDSQTRRRLVIASHASAVVVLGRSLSHTPARLPRLRALARHTPRRSFVRTRRPRLHLGAGNSSIRRVRAREGFRCVPRGSGLVGTARRRAGGVCAAHPH